ncbi:M48 family metalloprotease [Rubritalea tangerina]|uniref:M48 family metalloprotease n=1 Tax=Rubritalea tangerina TaxID=430798 RepID=A0ABW4ZAJ2_9BACT
MHDTPYSLDDISSAFSTKQREVKKLNASYKWSLGLTAIFMVLLPLVYLTIIGGVIYAEWLLWQHMQTPDGTNFWSIFAAVLGLVLILFLIKPIFAREPKQAEPERILPGSEPVLESLIGRICTEVNAPYPNEITLSSDVNASASLRRGIWSLFSNDLRLTIGLPLTYGLSAQQLSEVLAHEFGHFSQGFGMRATYIIRSINYWFLKVVYQRDRFDVWLEKIAKVANNEIRAMFLVGTARVLIWLTRMLLKGLMWIGQAVSCHTLRQMEYDADHHAARIVGSQCFAETSKRMHALMIGQHQAQELLEGMWIEKQLARNFPRLVTEQANQINEEQFEAYLEEKHKQEKQDLFDTHPSDSLRAAAVEKLNEAGVLHLERPATSLFSHLDQSARSATLRFYKDECDLDIEHAELLDSTKMHRELAMQKNREDGYSRWLYDAVGVICPAPSSLWNLPAPSTVELSNSAITRSQQTLVGAKDTTEKITSPLADAYSDLLRSRVALGFLAAGYNLPKGAFDLETADTIHARNLESESSHQLHEQRQALRDWHNKILPQMMLQLRQLITRGVIDETYTKELISFIAQLTNSMQTLEDMRFKLTPLTEVIQTLSDEEVPDTTMKWLTDKSDAVKADLAKLWDGLAHIPYPLSNSKQSLQTLAFQQETDSEAHPIINIAQHANLTSERLGRFYVDAIGELAALASVETEQAREKSA